MEKFTLDEAFDIIYTEALEEQLNEDINDLLKEQEEQAQFIDSLKILNDAYLFEVLTNNDENNEKSNSDGKNNNKYHEQTEFGKIMDFYDKMSGAIERRAKERANDTLTMRNTEASYKPEPMYQSVEKLSDMKFPQNIIFFITQLLKWIKNNVLNFIDKFSNIVRSLLGLESGKGRFSKEDLKLKLNKAKDIETKYLITDKDVHERTSSFENKLNHNFDYDDKDYYDGVNNRTRTIQLIDVPTNQVKALTEEYSNINLFNNILDEEREETTKCISIDTSKDLFALKQSLEHFYNLFDQAYGSNDEKLFGIDDLEIMIDLFKQTYNGLFSGKIKANEIAGSLSFDSGIDADKLKENLLRTRINTDNLKKAYIVTNKQINNISQIIMSKSLLGASNMGVSFAFLSASTYQVMIDLLETINTRLKEAKLMEKKLAKMKTAYENLVKTLEQRRASINAVSGITMTTVLQRQINELYDGARYMTQTVQLRMSTLSLYISELNDTRVILRNLNAIPQDAFRSNKSFFSKFKRI